MTNETTTNLFFFAAKDQWRFSTKIGSITVEDLFKLPLTSKAGKLCLNSVAIDLDEEIQKDSRKDFVGSRSRSDSVMVNKLELVKAVIADRIADNEAKNDAAKKLEKKHRLLGLLEEKQNEELKGLSKEDLLKELETLS